MSRRVLVVVVACLILVAMSAAASPEEVLIRESRYVVEQDGVTVGYDTYRLFETTEGYLYEQDSVAYFTLFDGSHEQTRVTYKTYVDSEYWPIRERATTESSGVTTTSDTEFAREGSSVKAVMVTTVSGRDHVDEATVEGRVIGPSEAVLEYLAASGQLEVGFRGEFVTWSSDRAQFDPLVVEVLEETTYEYDGAQQPAFVLSVVEQGIPVQVWVSPDGLQYGYRIPSIGIEARILDPQETIPEISPMTFETIGGEGNVRVRYPLRSTKSKITISFDGAPLGACSFTDNRQRIVSESVDEKGSHVVVEISVDTTDRTGRASLPVSDPSVLEYLSTTRHITPDYEPIREAALQAVGDETDIYRAVEKLLQFTHSYIKYSVSLEILTAPDIFEAQQGRCTEYAILFASFARSVGIPTRLAVGFRYDGMRWVGHMWNEVYIDEWIAVDPSHNQIAPDALLVKLAHGSSLTDEENLQATLFTGYRFNIEDVELRELDLPEGVVLETGISGSQYSNREYVYRISIPKHWTMFEAEQAGQQLLVMQPKDLGMQASAVVLAGDVPLGSRSDDALQAIVDEAAASMKLEVIEVESDAIFGNVTGSAAKIVVNANGVRVRQDVLVAVVEDLVYVLTLSAKEDDWKQRLEDLQYIRDSFVSWR